MIAKHKEVIQFTKIIIFIYFKIENLTSNYIAALGFYRFFYILHWYFNLK